MTAVFHVLTSQANQAYSTSLYAYSLIWGKNRASPGFYWGMENLSDDNEYLHFIFAKSKRWLCLSALQLFKQYCCTPLSRDARKCDLNFGLVGKLLQTL